MRNVVVYQLHVVFYNNVCTFITFCIIIINTGLKDWDGAHFILHE